jgi:mRNA interferase RelE/StbE
MAALPAGIRTKAEKFVFEELPEIRSLGESGKIEKMSGYREYYKVRFGPYRIGLKKEKEAVILKAVMHRSEIYRYFFHKSAPFGYIN